MNDDAPSVTADQFDEIKTLLSELCGIRMADSTTLATFPRALLVALKTLDATQDIAAGVENGEPPMQFSATDEMSERDAKLFVDACERYKRSPNTLLCPY